MKKRMKKLFSMVLAIAIVLGTIPVGAIAFAEDGQHVCEYERFAGQTDWTPLTEDTTKLEVDT